MKSLFFILLVVSANSYAGCNPAEMANAMSGSASTSFNNSGVPPGGSGSYVYVTYHGTGYISFDADQCPDQFEDAECGVMVGAFTYTQKKQVSAESPDHSYTGAHSETLPAGGRITFDIEGVAIAGTYSASVTDHYVIQL